jgi:hypothetical protein
MTFRAGRCGNDCIGRHDDMVLLYYRQKNLLRFVTPPGIFL